MRFGIRARVVGLLGAAGLAGVIAAQALWPEGPLPAPAEPWRTPVTPWGDPDLQGTWPLDDLNGTPALRSSGAAATSRTRSSRSAPLALPR